MGATQAPHRSKLAVLSLALSVLGCITCITGLIGAKLGHVSLEKIRRSEGQLSGSGLARAGVLVGYASCLVFAGLLFATGGRWWFGAVRSTEAISNGYHIYDSVYADAIGDDVVGFPEVGEYTTSTAYLQALAGDNPKTAVILNATPDYVAGPGVLSAPSWDALEAKHVLWSVTTGFTQDTKAGLPFAISANVAATRLHQLRGLVGENLDPSRKIPGNTVLVVLHGGGGKKLSPNDRWEDLFIATDYPDHPILRP